MLHPFGRAFATMIFACAAFAFGANAQQETSGGAPGGLPPVPRVQCKSTFESIDAYLKNLGIGVDSLPKLVAGSSCNGVTGSSAELWIGCSNPTGGNQNLDACRSLGTACAVGEAAKDPICVDKKKAEIDLNVAAKLYGIPAAHLACMIAAEWVKSETRQVEPDPQGPPVPELSKPDKYHICRRQQLYETAMGVQTQKDCQQLAKLAGIEKPPPNPGLPEDGQAKPNSTKNPPALRAGAEKVREVAEQLRQYMQQFQEKLKDLNGAKNIKYCAYATALAEAKFGSGGVNGALKMLEGSPRPTSSNAQSKAFVDCVGKAAAGPGVNAPENCYQGNEKEKK